MSNKNHKEGDRQGFGRLLTTIMAICLPMIAAAFFSGSFFKLGSAPVAHAAGHEAVSVVNVSITGSGFSPNSITISPGTQVTWTNNCCDRVRVRDSEHNLFDSDDLGLGQSFSYTFVSPGTIGVVEERNEFFMTVHVTGTPGPTGTAGATGTAGTTRTPGTTGTAGTTGTPGVTGTVGTPGPTNTPVSGQIVEVLIVSEDFPGYDPANVTIQSGTTVRWRNLFDDEHTTTSPGNWDSGEMERGATFDVTLIVNGTYNYFCAFHEDMAGSVTVVGGPTATVAPTGTPSSGTLQVNIQNFAFQPQNATVLVGSTVRWTNLDSAPHTATSPGNFDSGNLGQGQSYQFTFNTVGTYNYFCAVHPAMTGSITVIQPGQNTPTPQATNTPQPTNTPAATSTPGGPPVVPVTIQTYAYQPQHVTVAAGTIVRWTNLDNDVHTVTSPGNFNSGNFNQGQSWDYLFTTAGTYNYFCAVHPAMVGSVTVTGGGGSTPTAQATATTQPPTATAVATGQPTAPPTNTPAPQVHNVNMLNLAYIPREIRIRTGDTVRWTNSDPYPHTATSAGVFDSGSMSQGQTYQFTFNTPGTYDYICTIHPPQFMPAGRIIVEAPAPAATPTATRAPGQRFSDVFPNEFFYVPVNWLVSQNIVSGYADGTFRPYNNATRAQVTKMVVLGEGWQQINPPTPTFTDVAPGSTFYTFIETAVQHGIISGYSDRTFRPNADVTRGQLTKIVVSARGWQLNNPSTPTFSDVARGSTFYEYIETAVAHGILSGYSDGTFRPNNNATRGQISKILYNALTGGR